KLSAGKLSESIPGKFGGAAASAIIGGTASTLSGGKFANGALSGAFGYLFNQWAHSYSQQYDCIGTCHGNADTLGREMTPLQAAGLDAATTLAPYAGITKLARLGGLIAASRSVGGIDDTLLVVEKFFGGKKPDVVTNKVGDKIFMTNSKKVRFDIKNSHGDKPHVHFEQKVNNKWKDAFDQHRFYPKNK
ncbi:hypothetical protein, partial [Thiolapillus sp.]